MGCPEQWGGPSQASRAAKDTTQESGVQPVPSCWMLPSWSRRGCCPGGFDRGVQAALNPLVPGSRPLRRSFTRGSAGNCGPTAATSSWTSLTCEGCATGASARRPATPASLTTPRSSRCGGLRTSSSAQVRARKGAPPFPNQRRLGACRLQALGTRAVLSLPRHSVDGVVSDGTCFSCVWPLLLQFEVQLFCCGEDFQGSGNLAVSLHLASWDSCVA